MTRPAIKPGDHVVLVDGSSYIFRAYHALPPLTRPSDGMPVGAIAGFCNMLWKFLRDASFEPRPTHLAVVLDASEATFRKDIYPAYKAQRPDPPDDLKPQFGIIRDAVRAFDIACVELEGYEADDLIATYAEQAAGAGAEVTIVASDKDLMQLVREGVAMMDPVKQVRIGAAEVVEKFGVGPDLVVDVQALAGDSVDNVPGVPGIGIKTAAQLLGDYGDLETLLARAGEIRQPKRRESLINFADQARISKRLVTLDRSVPLLVPLDELKVREPDPKRLLAFLKAMEFNTLTKRVADAARLDANAIEPDEHLRSSLIARAAANAPAAPAPEAAEPQAAGDLFRADLRERLRSAPASRHRAAEVFTPAGLSTRRAAEALGAPCDRGGYETIREAARLEEWVAEAWDLGRLAVAIHAGAANPMTADLVGIALALAPGRAAYVPLGHSAGDDLLAGGRVAGQLRVEDALALLKPLLQSPAVLKIGHDLKADALILSRHGVGLRAWDDVMLISYALDSGRGGHGLSDLAKRHLSHLCLTLDEVTGTGRNRLPFAHVEIERAAPYGAETADIALRLWRALKPRLPAEGLTRVYERLERPLIPVLARMETYGISIDRQILSRLSGEFAQSMARLEDEIYGLAGETFNLGSPKQLGDILFGKLGLPGASRTKTGAWSTGAQILEDLAEAGHDLPRRILDWRQLSKLKSTYTDALPSYVNPQTGRVHTTFQLAATSTGRLSSAEPNIQNIPVRTEEGRKIRKAFVAGEGTKLVSADYSQIELRILAHIADIPQLKAAFAEGQDIHALTASEMFGVPVAGMPAEVRRRAKAINFGIIYGISAFGLANQLGIGQKEARDYIAKYFERFPGIRDYMEATKAEARRNGYVRTVFGRRCHFQLINSKSVAERSFHERAAINAPIQGSAADIIRRAMMRMEAALAAERLSARMLLQVHDELVFEAPDDEVRATLPVIRHVMEKAAEPAVALSVPLHVDARAADNWDEAH